MTMFLIILLVAYCSGSALPPNINKCHIRDDECATALVRTLLPHVATGVPEYNVISLDPLNIKELNIKTPSLTINFEDIVIKGIKNADIKHVELTDNRITFQAIAKVEAKAKYDVNGELLRTLKVEDKGQAFLRIDVTIDATLNTEVTKGKDGKSYWKTKSLDHKYVINDASISLDSANTSNKVINQAIQQLLTDNPKEVISEIAPDVVKKLIVILTEQLKNFFHHQPLNTLVTNPEYQ